MPIYVGYLKFFRSFCHDSCRSIDEQAEGRFAGIDPYLSLQKFSLARAAQPCSCSDRGNKKLTFPVSIGNKGKRVCHANPHPCLNYPPGPRRKNFLFISSIRKGFGMYRHFRRCIAVSTALLFVMTVTWIATFSQTAHAASTLTVTTTADLSTCW